MMKLVMKDDELRHQLTVDFAATVASLRRVGETLLRQGEIRLANLAAEVERAHRAGELSPDQLAKCREVGLLPTPARHELN